MPSLPKTVTVVAIQNYGSSGSLFLQSLLDGHPSLLALPALYIRPFYSFWEEHGAKPREAVVGAFLKKNSYWFKPDGINRGLGLEQMGESMKEGAYIDEELFTAALKDLLESAPKFDRRTMLLSVYLAYARARGLEVPENACLVFPIHSMPRRHAGSLLEDFKDVRFLHMIREPLVLIGSMIKHILTHSLPVSALECAFSQMIADYSQQWEKSTHGYVYGDRPYFPEAAAAAVRLEDLNARSRETLEGICRWLGIPWHDCLLTSTFNGKKWWNRPESPRVSGFGGALIGKQHDHWFNGFDTARLQGVLAAKYRLWNYPSPAWTRSPAFRAFLPLLLLFPFKAEFKSALGHWFNFIQAVPSLLWDWVKAVHGLTGRLGLGEIDHEKGRQIKARLAAAIRENFLLKAAAGLAALLAAPVLLLSGPFFLLRDYVMIRRWLARGWRESFASQRPEVRLLD